MVLIIFGARKIVPQGPMPRVRLEAPQWVWVRPDDWPIEALERNWGAHYHLRLC
jgi:hypothetical protein